MGRHRLAAGLTAAILLGSGLVASGGTASASTVHAAGSISCRFATTLTFSPPLTPGRGTQVAKGVSEIITVAPASVDGCTGSTTVGSVPVSGTGTKPLTVKMKPVVVNHVDYAGGCFFFSPFQLALKKAVLSWTAGSGLLATTSMKLNAGALGANGMGSLGYAITGTARGSFAGPVALGAYFDAASTLAVQDCVGGTGSVSSVTVDPTQSTIAIG